MDSDEHIARSLRERRHRLAEELARLTEAPATGVNVSFGKRIGDGTTEAIERISTTATARSLTASLAAIDRALVKLAEGSYGRCDRCRRAIGPERLEAIPAASHCVECSAADHA